MIEYSITLLLVLVIVLSITNRSKVFRFKNTLRDAKSGDPKSQYNLYRYYKYGIGTKVDLNKSFHWLRQSAEKENISAIFALGIYYESKTISVFKVKAFRTFSLGYNNGCSKCGMKVAEYLHVGDVVKKDNARSRNIFEDNYLKLSNIEFIMLAKVYVELGDDIKFLDLVERKELQDDPDILFIYGTYLLDKSKNSEDTHRGIVKLNRASKMGNKQALYQVASIYIDGKFLPRNTELAEDILKKLSKVKYKPAINLLARIRNK